MFLPGIYVLLSLVVIAGLSTADDDCPQQYECLSASRCDTLTGGIVYPCNNGEDICCPVRSEATVSRFAKFPKDCGLLTDTDRITAGKNASIGQFPWMALLGYKTKDIDLVQFLCGGSLISANYVLTAAHCLTIGRLELSTVRLGELDLTKDVDCEVHFNRTTCADPHIDVNIANIIMHENFNSTTLKNDIGLVKLASKVNFTDYIQPICLPFATNIIVTNKTRFTISGWGKTQPGNFGGSLYLQFAHILLWDRKRCEKYLTSAVKPLHETQVCGNGPNAEDACKGDSGGPLFSRHPVDFDVKFFQFGVISFASTPTCGIVDLPTIYTKVDKYLTWIADKAK